MSEIFLYVVFPYAAFLLAIAVGIYRYRSDRFSFTSRSSQFLEDRLLFFGSISWHYAIGIILAAHILAAIFPESWAALLGSPLRLLILEGTGLALGVAATAGIAAFALRRIFDARIAATTETMDWIVLATLLFQTGSGVYVAWKYRFGAAWYLHTAVPWLWSLARLSPEPAYVTVLPLAAKLHLLNAFFLVALLPFTRLVHLFSIPVSYAWRPNLLFRWNRKGPYLSGDGR
ncbi:MAG: respiratory nitrate reductase subunit gamma [Deltaproteobacteria bacterium]|nr:respiratory nitrate reductase subunit gamma [Deltaproteobacteria bacterium]